MVFTASSALSSAFLTGLPGNYESIRNYIPVLLSPIRWSLTTYINFLPQEEDRGGFWRNQEKPMTT
jgi:hypothetical protein